MAFDLSSLAAVFIFVFGAMCVAAPDDLLQRATGEHHRVPTEHQRRMREKSLL